MDPAIVLAVISLLGVVATGVFSYLGQRQTQKATKASHDATMARGEIELALATQSATLKRIHESHKAEVEEILARSERNLVAIRAEYENQISELRASVRILTVRAERAERRASQFETKAMESATHAARCDEALNVLQADYTRLEQKVRGMTK